MKIEAIDSSEIETVEFNESDSETIDTMEPGPSSAITASAGGTVANTSSKLLHLFRNIYVFAGIFFTNKLGFLSIS